MVCITQSALEKAGSLFVVMVFTVSPVPAPLDVVAELDKAEKYPCPPLFKRRPVTGPVVPLPLIADTEAIPPTPEGMKMESPTAYPVPPELPTEIPPILEKVRGDSRRNCWVRFIVRCRLIVLATSCPRRENVSGHGL